MFNNFKTTVNNVVHRVNGTTPVITQSKVEFSTIENCIDTITEKGYTLCNKSFYERYRPHEQECETQDKK